MLVKYFVRIFERPTGLTYKHIIAVGVLSGIGFTMSIFVAGLAFNDSEQIAAAKLSILIASSIAIILGVIVLYFATSQKKNRRENLFNESLK